MSESGITLQSRLITIFQILALAFAATLNAAAMIAGFIMLLPSIMTLAAPGGGVDTPIGRMMLWLISGPLFAVAGTIAGALLLNRRRWIAIIVMTIPASIWMLGSGWIFYNAVVNCDGDWVC